MKQLNLFFEGEISKYFDGCRNLYIGDKDFVFANDDININAEIKTISKNNTFRGKKISFTQAREYASQVDIIDNLNRHTKCYLFEYHKYASNPYIIVVPFKRAYGMETQAHELLEFKKAKMLYLYKDNQFNRWLSGDKFVGITPRKKLLCVNV
jgi:hypothetical protein